ncbi:MAG: hypothetical protein D6706_13690 [Chloroflexi bacterium]|nr:MAG: hypothetical protein D6706_13690 [Chloroflexota bacterium]
MIRPFHLRDLALVRRLSEGGVPLHTESALTSNLNPWRSALYSLVGGDFPTYVCKLKEQNAAGFIQLVVEDGQQHAHILFLSSTAREETNVLPNSHIDEDVWLLLLDQAVTEIGRRGIHSLVAEVSETGDELPVLRRAGFAVYTRQDIWVINPITDKTSPHLLRPRQSADDWEIQLLYANTVPRLVQLVEPVPPIEFGDGWVLRENDELTAFVHFHCGSTATWMRLFVHPNAEAMTDEILAEALQISPQKNDKPVYCCVRRYQSWIQNSLQRYGFRHWGSQAVMVKHVVKPVQKPVGELSRVIEQTGIPASAPIVHHWQQTDSMSY